MFWCLQVGGGHRGRLRAVPVTSLTAPLIPAWPGGLRGDHPLPWGHGAQQGGGGQAAAGGCRVGAYGRGGWQTRLALL